MNSSWHSGNEAAGPDQSYRSTCCPGVSFRVKRMTLGGRIELLERIYPLLKEAESMAAGASQSDQVRNQLCTLKIQEALLSWGVLELSGWCVDGVQISAEQAGRGAPENLVQEMLTVIQRQRALTEAERKN